MKFNTLKFVEILLQSVANQLLFIAIPILSIIFLVFPFVALYLFDWAPREVFKYTATEVFITFLTTLCCWSMAYLMEDFVDSLKKAHIIVKIIVYSLLYTGSCYIVYMFVKLMFGDTMPIEGIVVVVLLSSLNAILLFEKGLLHGSKNLMIASIVIAGLAFRYLGLTPFNFFLIFTVLRLLCWLVTPYLKRTDNGLLK